MGKMQLVLPLLLIYCRKCYLVSDYIVYEIINEFFLLFYLNLLKNFRRIFEVYINAGDSILKLRTQLKNQKKVVRNLKKKSLWSRSLEEVAAKCWCILLSLETLNIKFAFSPKYYALRLCP